MDDTIVGVRCSRHHTLVFCRAEVAIPAGARLRLEHDGGVCAGILEIPVDLLAVVSGERPTARVVDWAQKTLHDPDVAVADGDADKNPPYLVACRAEDATVTMAEMARASSLAPRGDEEDS